MTQTISPALGKGRGLTRRQRARVVRGGQYLVGIAVIALFVTQTDWSVFSASFLRSDIFKAMWPRVITVGLVNTVIYTLLAFVFAFVVGLFLALMKLS